MTIPKPMRILGALTLCIIVFLFMQVFRAEPAAIEMPGSEKKGSKGNENTLKQWTHDPQEDGKSGEKGRHEFQG
jgi:mannosyltransferase